MAASDVLKPTATKIPVVGLTVTEDQFPKNGKLWWAHVIPSVDLAASDELLATTAKIPVVELTVTEDHSA
jgi:hypothetical protein